MFGNWFLGTSIWDTRVLEIALKDLENLIKERKESYPVIVDVGCGRGRSFRRLRELFAPDLLIGAEIDEDLLSLAAVEAEKPESAASLVLGTSASLALADRSVDMLISRLRKKLDDDSRSPRFIKTVWRTGYQFVGASDS